MSLQKKNLATCFFSHQVVLKKFLMFYTETKNQTKTEELYTSKRCLHANPVISKYLSDIFNVCLGKGTYPDLLKIAEKIPIFKKDERNKTTNYRPVQYHFFHN